MPEQVHDWVVEDWNGYNEIRREGEP